MKLWFVREYIPQWGNPFYVYVIAESDDRALELARQRFKETFPDLDWDNRFLEVELMTDNFDKEWVGEVH